MVPRGGIEPPTRGFSVLCSTITIEDVRFWPKAVIRRHEIKRLPSVRFFTKKIFGSTPVPSRRAAETKFRPCRSPELVYIEVPAVI